MRAISVIGDNKICTKCNVEKKCEDYSIKRKSPDGRENVCKKCRNESQKERRKVQRSGNLKISQEIIEHAIQARGLIKYLARVSPNDHYEKAIAALNRTLKHLRLLEIERENETN